MLLSVWLGACATKAPLPPERLRVPAESGSVSAMNFGRLALVVKPVELNRSFLGYLRSKSEGAEQYATEGMLGTTELCVRVLMSSYGGIFFLPICPFVGMVGAGVGAVTGTIGTPSEEAVTASERSIHGALYASSVQDALRREVERAARSHGRGFAIVEQKTAGEFERTGDYRVLGEIGVDQVMEVAVQLVGISGRQFTMVADASIVDTRDRRVIRSVSASLDFGDFSVPEWGADEGRRFDEALKTGIEILGRYLYDKVFYSIYPYGALGAIHPRDGETLSDQKPVLRREVFPRPLDTRYDIGEVSRARQIRYDLLMAKATAGQLLQVVYRKESLPEPTHQPDIELERGATYWWAARARFVLDGVERMTEWSPLADRSGPTLFAHRFQIAP